MKLLLDVIAIILMGRFIWEYVLSAVPASIAPQNLHIF